MCHEIRRMVLAREAAGRTELAQPIDPVEPDCEEHPTARARWRWLAAMAALFGAGSLIAPAHGQPFDAVIGPPALELAPLPVCNESMIEEISYERAGMKRYLVLPESNPQVWYVLGISNTTGRDAGASISRVDCSVVMVVNDPEQRRPWCEYMPNPGPFCVGINVGPATRN